MKHRCLGVGLAALLCLEAVVAQAADLVLKRVMLSTGGVAYLEHEAEVTGDATLSLDLPLDQIDDVLKSIVVYDSKGGVGSASLPGREPLAALFGDLPFSEDALSSPAALLNALQGAEIRVGASHPITGKLLKVVPETVRVGEQGTTERNRVTILGPTGLQQFILEDTDTVGFADPELQAKVEKALSATASHRAKDRRQIVLTMHGSGRRTVRVGYVVGAPLWKATFRMTLPADAVVDKAKLQGWAVLENMSGQDWQGIELTLLSGNPVSFRQAIYEAYYVTRPEVPVEVAGRILPRLDRGVIDKAVLGQINGSMTGSASGSASASLAMNMPAPIGVRPGSQQDFVPELRSRPVDVAEAQEGVTQVAFRLPVPVTLANGQSAIVPIIDRDVPIERLALFQASTSTTHPLASLKVKNDGASGLPPGVLTLYEETADGPAYVGDARLAGLPAGEDRLLSYAVDEKTRVSRESQGVSLLAKATVADGVLTLTRMEQRTVLYHVVAPASEARHLILEQAKLEGWRLVEPAERAVDQTAGAYRLALDLKPGDAKTISMVTEFPRLESVRIVDADDARIAAVMATRDLDPAVKTALAELARLRRDLAEKRAAEQALEEEIQALTADQSRIRDNLASADKESALHKRYMEKLAQQETRVETLQTAIAAATEASHKADAAIGAYMAKLSI